MDAAVYAIANNSLHHQDNCFLFNDFLIVFVFQCFNTLNFNINFTLQMSYGKFRQNFSNVSASAYPFYNSIVCSYRFL